MTLGIVIVALIAFSAYAVAQGRQDVLFTVGGYIMSAAFITILLIFACLAGYTYFIHYLWTL